MTQGDFNIYMNNEAALLFFFRQPNFFNCEFYSIMVLQVDMSFDLY